MAEGDINALFGKVAKLDQRVTKIEATQPFLTEILELLTVPKYNSGVFCASELKI